MLLVLLIFLPALGAVIIGVIARAPGNGPRPVRPPNAPPGPPGQLHGGP